MPEAIFSSSHQNTSSLGSILKGVTRKAVTQVPEPPIAWFLFADTRMAWFWLIVHVYVAYEWFTAGWEKLTGTSINITTFGKSTGSA